MIPFVRVYLIGTEISIYSIFTLVFFEYMARHIPRLKPRSTVDAGRSLFTSEEVPAAIEILRIDSPLVAVLDSSHLQDTCACCFSCLPNIISHREGLPENPQNQERRRLKSCLGCKAVRYCSKVSLRLQRVSMPLLLNSASAACFYDGLLFHICDRFLRPCWRLRSRVKNLAR